MQAFIFKKHLDGYLKLSAFISSVEWNNLPELVRAEILEQSYSKWPEDFSMQAYILEKQTDGFYSLLNLEEKFIGIQPKIIEKIKLAARNAWDDDLQMQAFFINKEINKILSESESKPNR